MRGKTIILSLGVCLLLSLLSGRSFSQGRGSRSADLQRWMKQQQLEDEQRRKANETAMAKYQDEAYREAVGATEDQWQKIKPRLEKVRQLSPTPGIGIAIYGGSAGGGSLGGGATNGRNSGGLYGGGSNGSGGVGGFGRGSFSSRDPNSGAVVTRSFSFGGPGDGNTSGDWMQFSDGGAGGDPMEGQTPIKKQAGGMSMGWQWQKIPVKDSPSGVRKGEKACDELLDVVKAASPDPVQTRQKVEALRQARRQLQEELRTARDALRKVVTPAQEARLILMGYLD